jgi:hypothetical protein
MGMMVYFDATEDGCTTTVEAFRLNLYLDSEAARLPTIGLLVARHPVKPSMGSSSLVRSYELEEIRIGSGDRNRHCISTMSPPLFFPSLLFLSLLCFLLSFSFHVSTRGRVMVAIGITMQLV